MTALADVAALHAFDPDQLLAPICTECGKLMPCPTMQLVQSSQARQSGPRWWVCYSPAPLAKIGATWSRYAVYAGTPERMTALAIDLGDKVVGLEASPEGHFMRLVGNPNRIYLHTKTRPGPDWYAENAQVAPEPVGNLRSPA